MVANHASPTIRFRTPLDFALFMVATFGLGLAGIVVRILPFGRLLGAMGRLPARHIARIDPGRIVLAVERAATRVPWRSVCLDQAIVAHVILGLAGHPSRFIYGAAVTGGILKAHAWVGLGGEILIGENAAHDCAELVAVP